MIRPATIAIFVALTLSLQSCFTGIESTKTITASDVKKENIVTLPEQTFLADIKSEPPAQWRPGKRFHVTDNKIAVVLPTLPETIDIAGTDLVYTSTTSAPTLNGVDVATFNFLTADSTAVSYRTNLPYDRVSSREGIEIPFTIELSVVDSIRSRLTGKRFFITTPLWYDETGANAVHGLRHVPVDIVDVRPGNSVYPVCVVFHYADSPVNNSVLMTYGQSRTATRNFETLMAFTDPRVKHPEISPEVWQLIINSRVREGMTKTECRLALGQPDVAGERPSTAGMVEYWSYTDGKYLLFEDGILTIYRN